jgi:hypothetical protein
MPDINSQLRAIKILNRIRDITTIQDKTAAQTYALLPSILERAFKGDL